MEPTELPELEGARRSGTASFARHAAGVISVTTLARVVAAVGGVLVARALGPEDRGVLALIVLGVTSAATLATCGLDYWVLREATTSQTDRGVRRTIDRHLALMTPVAVLPIIVAAVAHWDMVVAAAVGALVIATIAFMPYSLVPLAKGRPFRYGVVSLLDAGFPLAVGIAMLITGRGSVTALLVAWAIGRLLAAFVGRRELRGAVVGPQWSYMSVLRFGFPVAIGVLVTVAIYRADAAVVAGFLSAGDVGVYVAAAAVLEFTFVLPDSVGQVLVGRVGGEDGGERTARSARLVTTAVLVVSVIVAVGGPWLMELLYGNEYRRGWVALPPLAVAATTMALWKVLVFDLVGRGDNKVRVTSGTLALVVMLLSDLWLVPAFGVAGAGFGSLLGCAAAAAMALRVWSRATGRGALSTIGLRSGDLGNAFVSLRGQDRHPESKSPPDEVTTDAD